jgi:hypothetical protein
MDPNVPTCHLAEEVGTVRRRLGDGPTFCVMVNERRIVAGRLEHLDRIDAQDRGPASEMRAGPTTIRPSEELSASGNACANDKSSSCWLRHPTGNCSA